MEDNSLINNTSTSAPAPPASAPAPAPVFDTPPPAAPPPVQFAQPGPASPYAAQKFDMWRDINWTETLLLGLFGTAFAYVIVYYRFKLKEDKIINSDIQRQLDGHNMRIGKMETGLSYARIPY